MIPTKEQIQWFWEQCGFRYLGKHINYNYGDSVEAEQDLWEWPSEKDGQLRYFAIPGINSLDNLFKYAVPKLYDDMVYGRLQGGEFDESDYIDLIVGWAESVARDKQDPALALFWAIYKALGGKE